MNIFQHFIKNGDVCPHCGENITFITDDPASSQITYFTGYCDECPAGTYETYTQKCNDKLEVMSASITREGVQGDHVN